MGKQNFRGYLISRFYPTREIRENLMHAKNMFYSRWCIQCPTAIKVLMKLDHVWLSFDDKEND